MACRFQLVNITLNVRVTQKKGQIWVFFGKLVHAGIMVIL